MSSRLHQSLRIWALAGTVGLLSSACAGAALQTDASTSAIRAAEEVGAEQVPRASLHLQLAKESLAEAERLSAAGDDEEAKSMLSRAEADAELAVVLSREDAERAESKAAVERVRQLREDNTSSTSRNPMTSELSQP
jgi:hypothetical protein